MRTSTRFTIAVHTLLCIARFSDSVKTTSTFIADSVNVNPVVIRQTLGALKAAGMVSVEAGVGGASLAKDARSITLLDVYRATEGQEANLFGFHENPNAECPVGSRIHGVLDGRLEDAQVAFEQSLAQTTLQDLIDEL